MFHRAHGKRFPDDSLRLYRIVFSKKRSLEAQRQSSLDNKSNLVIDVGNTTISQRYDAFPASSFFPTPCLSVSVCLSLSLSFSISLSISLSFFRSRPFSAYLLASMQLTNEVAAIFMNLHKMYAKH